MFLEGTSRRSRDEILEAAGHHAHVTRRTQGPFWLCSVASRSLLHRVGGLVVEVLAATRMRGRNPNLKEGGRH